MMNYLSTFFKWINKNRDKGELYFILLVISVIFTSGILTKLYKPNLGIAMILCFTLLVIFRAFEDVISYFFKGKNQKERLFISIIPHSIVISITILINYIQ